MRQFPVSYDTMTENKYLNAGHFLGQLILNRSIFPKPLHWHLYTKQNDVQHTLVSVILQITG